MRQPLVWRGRGRVALLIPSIHLVQEPHRDAKQGTPHWTAIYLSWWPGEERDGTGTHVGAAVIGEAAE